jgi:hypothetical protein
LGFSTGAMKIISRQRKAFNVIMTIRLLKCVLTLALFFTLSGVVCGQKINIKQASKSNQQHLQYDTSKIAIITLSKAWHYPFDSTYRHGTLIQVDINSIDSLLIECISNYNNSLDSQHKQFSIDFNDSYKRQLVIAINNKGEKEVWVNCFCRSWGNRWKKQIMLVSDGGTCYFNFKINLATKKYYDLGVNGYAYQKTACNNWFG